MNPQHIYCQSNLEYQLTMNEHQFHDSGIVDEGLSDEEEKDKPKKPSQSYLEIIAEAILKAPNRTMQLYEIYHYFQRKYRYFAEDVNKSWRNSVRHNLSLNDCFVKAGRGANGKGHYWRIHELAEQDFEQGRFRRRRHRQQMRQLQIHPSPYEPPSTYPPNSYYMYIPPPSYHSIYPTENYPDSYSFYDPYYPTGYPPIPMSYPNPTESDHFDA